jgi:hypothetical protein
MPETKSSQGWQAHLPDGSTPVVGKVMKHELRP